MTDPILITGCARSGTSMVAGIVNICGAFGGTLVGPTRNNRKGMFENNAVRNAVLKPYLRKLGCDPMGQHPLPNVDDVRADSLTQVPNVHARRYDDWRAKVTGIIKHEGYQGGPWFYKDAKCCLVWPIWDLAFPHAKWIIVRRDTEAIAESCVRTSFMRAYKTKEAWGIWIAHHLRCFRQMRDVCENVIEVSSDDIVAGDFRMIERAVTECGLDWAGDKVAKFVDPALFHQVVKQQ